MHSILAILTTSLLTYTLAVPVSPPSDSPSSVQLQEHLAVVSKVSSPIPTPGTVFVMPPPLFDPAEPRPDPLFDSSAQPFITAETSRLKAPPIQESRSETLLPFDGAHVHPFATPYTPESLPGTCAHSRNCSLIRTSAEIGGSLLLLLSTVYAVICMCDKVIRHILWTAKITRSRSPSGSLRLEPELGTKSPQPGTPTAADIKAPLVKVWCEKGLEKVVVVTG